MIELVLWALITLQRLLLFCLNEKICSDIWIEILGGIVGISIEAIKLSKKIIFLLTLLLFFLLCSLLWVLLGLCNLGIPKTLGIILQLLRWKLIASFCLYEIDHWVWTLSVGSCLVTLQYGITHISREVLQWLFGKVPLRIKLLNRDDVIWVAHMVNLCSQLWLFSEKDNIIRSSSLK